MSVSQRDLINENLFNHCLPKTYSEQIWNPKRSLRETFKQPNTEHSPCIVKYLTSLGNNCDLHQYLNSSNGRRL